MPDYHRILITGAAGSLGGHLRPASRTSPTACAWSTSATMGAAGAARGDRASATSPTRRRRSRSTRDCDAILHFAGHPREQSFEEIVADTLPAAYHVYEGARRHGAQRVVYASSIHAVGFHAGRGGARHPACMHRPDTFYGLTKTFVEDLASLYWDKFGIESVCLRICSCFPEPRDRRMLWSWLCFADCVRLAEAALTAPRVGFSVIYGTSDNAARRRLERPRRATSASGRGTAPTASPRRSWPRTERPDPAAVATRVVGGGFAATAAPRRLTAAVRLFEALLGHLAAGRDPAARPLDAAARRRRRQPRLGGDARRPGRRHRRGRGGDARLGPAAALHDPPRRRGARRARSPRAATLVRDPTLICRGAAAAAGAAPAGRARDPLRRRRSPACARSGPTAASARPGSR